MRTFVIVILPMLMTAVFGGRANAASEAPTELKPFDITKEPQKSDWRYFHNAAEKVRYDLWRYHRSQGIKLSDWSWGWRLGWVRACGKSTKKYCRVILSRALTDDALVVRAESATVYGRRYAETGKKLAIDHLTTAYQNKENFRNGKPLFVTKRILFALHQIGGSTALEQASRLAKSHNTTANYWRQVAR